MNSFYGEVDRKGNEADGSICSEMPAWTQDAQVSELGEEIDTLQRDLDAGIIPPDEVFSHREELKTLNERYDGIVASRPSLNLSDENVLSEAYDKMSEDEADSLYSRYEQRGKNLASPQREADLNDFPCIKVNPLVAEMCNLAGMIDGKASRNQIDKARTIIGHYFGRDDVGREYIRKENASGRKKSRIGYINPRSARRHEQIFGKHQLDVEDVSRETILDKAIEAVAHETESKTVSIEAKTSKSETPWECKEAGCGFKGTMKQKGMHIARHRKQEKAVAKKAEEAKELVEV